MTQYIQAIKWIRLDEVMPYDALGQHQVTETRVNTDPFLVSNGRGEIAVTTMTKVTYRYYKDGSDEIESTEDRWVWNSYMKEKKYWAAIPPAIDEVQPEDNQLIVEYKNLSDYRNILLEKTETLSPEAGGEYAKGYEKAKQDTILLLKSVYAQLSSADNEIQFYEANNCVRNFIDEIVPSESAVGSYVLSKIRDSMWHKLGPYMLDSYMMGRNEGQYESEKTINKLKEDLKQANSNYKAICGLYGPAQQELSDLKASLRQLIKN